MILNFRPLKLTALIWLVVIKKRNWNKSKKECITWLSLHGLETSRTMQELRMRIYKFQLYSSLAKKIKVKNEKKKTFEISPISSGWSCGYSILRNVTASVFTNYASKRRGCYWPTAESILNVDKQEDLFVSVKSFS